MCEINIGILFQSSYYQRDMWGYLSTNSYPRAWWILRVTGHVDCIEPWPVLIHRRAAENSQEHLAHFLWNCAGVIILIITGDFTFLTRSRNQDGSRRRTRRGEVLGEEMQAGQHVQPHLRLLPCRDCRGWEHRNVEWLRKSFESFPPCLFTQYFTFHNCFSVPCQINKMF